MKEVTLILSGRLRDPETGKTVMLGGTKLTGTPLQVGIIFEHLMALPGAPDLIGVATNIEVYRESKLALKRVRRIQDNRTVVDTDGFKGKRLSTDAPSKPAQQ